MTINAAIVHGFRYLKYFKLNFYMGRGMGFSISRWLMKIMTELDL